MLSIVIPTYNRCNNLIKNYEAIEAALSKKGILYELIFVDDGSKDDTEHMLQALAGEVDSVSGIILSGNSGQQNATLAGIRQAKYPYVVTMDDDLSLDPAWIIALWDKIKEGYSVVYGVPVDKHDETHRNLGTSFKEVLFYALLGKPLGVRLTSFRIIGPELVDFIRKDDTRKVYISARTLRFTKNIGNISLIRLTKGERSHYTVLKLMGLLLSLVRNYTFMGRIFREKDEKQYDIKEIFQ